MYHTITNCRACNGTDLVEVFNFGAPQPLANNFVKPGEAREGFVPLRVMFCRTCTLAQLGEVVDPNVLYKNYLYVTSSSQTMQRHFDRLTKDIISENGHGSLLEVGSNDGRFLNFAAFKGFGPCTGIDPANNLAGTLELHPAVNIVTDFFNPKLAANSPRFDTIAARHCFCHQEWRPFMEAVTMLAHPKTLVCIEVPYAPDLLRRVEFDSIYHEHTSYFTLHAMKALLKDYPFHIHGVIRYGIHGGAVLVMLRHNDSGITPHLSADEMMAEENVTEQHWRDFGARATEKITRLMGCVSQKKKEGAIISAFGASAKATVLINACMFTDHQISFVTDNSPLKPGRLIPGTQIPIIDESEMLSQHPDYSIMTAWNYESEILCKNEKWRSRGGKFIIPGAELRIV